MFFRIIAITLLAFSGFSAEKENLPKPKEVLQVKKKLPTLAAMVKVVGFPVLYVANNEEWTSIVVKDDAGYRVLNARAMTLPILMHLRPGDNLTVVLQDNDGQEWVLGLTLIGNDGRRSDIEVERGDTIVKFDRNSDRNVLPLETRKGHKYHIDKKLAQFKYHNGYRVKTLNWTRYISKGRIVQFSYIQRGNIRWVTSAKTIGFRTKNLRNPHGEQPIVTRIWKGRRGTLGQGPNDWWYYVQTDHPKIKYEVDSRWNRDVRLQKVGQPPLWHKDREPSPYSDLAVLGRPTRNAGPGVVVNVQGSTAVSNSLTNNRVSSSNQVSSLNQNVNANENTSTNNNANDNNNNNTNNNQNQNQNNNTNNNQNNNTNDNQNNNNNQNDVNNQNNNSNQNQNDLNNNNTNNLNNSNKNSVSNSQK